MEGRVVDGLVDLQHLMEETKDHNKDRRLFEATIEGNSTSLIELLKEDPLLLERTLSVSSCTSFCNHQNPLHVAAMLGHVDFAREILSRKPDLVSETDSEGFSPLLLASARKNIDMVRVLLRAEPGVCLITDNDGRTPLHVAAMKGRVEIMKELFQCRPEAIDQVMLNRGETILHLCASHGRLEAFKLLLKWVQSKGSSVTVNSKDDDGNTVLHLAVAKKHIQIIKLLLLSSDEVEVNALNQNGFTALDISAQNPVRDGKDLEIGEIVRGAGGLRSKDVVVTAASANGTVKNHGAHVVNISRDNRSSASTTRSTSINGSSGGGGDLAGLENSRSWKTHLNEHEKWLKKKQSTLMVVVSLIASMAFQAMLNPPSGLQEQKRININQTSRVDAAAGIPPTSTTDAYNDDRTDFGLNLYVHCNTIGFIASMSVTVLLVSGLPLKRRFFIWVLMIIMWVATTSLTLSYMATTQYWFPKSGAYFYGSFVWRVLTIFIMLMHTTRFLLWILKKTGSRCKRILLMFWWPLVLGGILYYLYYLFIFAHRRGSLS